MRKPPRLLAVADATTGGGIGSGTLQQAQDQLTPLSTSNEFISKVVAGLIIASAVLTIGGLAIAGMRTARRTN